jgi:hypothetical protein
VSLVFSRGKLVDGDLSGALPQCFYLQDRPVDFGSPQMRFGHDPGYRTTMSGDDNCLAALDFIEKLGEVSLSLLRPEFGACENLGLVYFCGDGDE